MNPTFRAALLAAAIFGGTGGLVAAAEQPAATSQGHGESGHTTSVGAGGLTGSGATQDGARRTDGKTDDGLNDPSTPRGGTGSSAPAAGTTR